MSDDRPPVYWEGSELIIRASAIGTDCLYELIAAGQGYPPATLPAMLRERFEQGHQLEPVVVAEMEKQGWVFSSHQSETHLIFVNEGIIKVRSHSDGLAMGPQTGGEMCVVEIKALSENNFKVARDKGLEAVVPEYPWQLSVMMHAEGLPGMWVVLDKSQLPEIVLHYDLQMVPPIDLGDIRDKAYAVKEGVEGPDILEEGRACDNPKHWPCRYLHLRPESDGPTLLPELGEGDFDRDEINQLVREYLLFKGQADEANQRRDELKRELLKRAEELGVTKIVTDLYVVPVVEGASISLDTDALAADGIDITKYKKKTRYKYLRGVKRIDE